MKLGGGRLSADGVFFLDFFEPQMDANGLKWGGKRDGGEGGS